MEEITQKDLLQSAHEIRLKLRPPEPVKNKTVPYVYTVPLFPEVNRNSNNEKVVARMGAKAPVFAPVVVEEKKKKSKATLAPPTWTPNS